MHGGVVVIWIALIGLIVILAALVIDRRLTQARQWREAQLEYEAQLEFERSTAERLRVADLERRRELDARRQQARLDEVQFDRLLGRLAESGTAGVPRPPKSGTPTAMQSGAHARTGIGSGSQPAPATCPTTQPHHYLPSSIYAPAADTRSDCGSSWSSSSDSGSSSCDSSSSGGGE